MQHPRQLHVRCVDRFTARAGEPVDATGVASDDLERPGRPRVERILLDDDPLLGVVPFDLFLGADQPCQPEIASSIFG